MLPSAAAPFVLENDADLDGGPHMGKYTHRSFRAFTKVAGAPQTPIDAYYSSSLPAFSEKSGVR